MRSNFREFGSGKLSQGFIGLSMLTRVKAQPFLWSTNAPAQGRKLRNISVGEEKLKSKDVHTYSELRRIVEW